MKAAGSILPADARLKEDGDRALSLSAGVKPFFMGFLNSIWISVIFIRRLFSAKRAVQPLPEIVAYEQADARRWIKYVKQILVKWDWMDEGITKDETCGILSEGNQVH